MCLLLYSLSEIYFSVLFTFQLALEHCLGSSLADICVVGVRRHDFTINEREGVMARKVEVAQAVRIACPVWCSDTHIQACVACSFIIISWCN